MPRQRQLAASAFWQRFEEALGHKWIPFNPNSVATRLDMSQGSVHRWYTGEGLPELATALDLADEGGVCVDWLLNGVKPKYPISKDPVLKELFEIGEQLSTEARDRVLRAAKGELALLKQELEQRNEAHEPASSRRAR